MTTWNELREDLLPEPDGEAVIERRGTGLSRWLRGCRDDPTCTVSQAAPYAQAQGRRPRRSEGAWREFLRESGDVREGETEADASRRVGAESVERVPSHLEGLLRG